MMKNKFRIFCELNACSDSYDKQYPECEMKIHDSNVPVFCPKRDAIKGLFTREQALQEEVEGLREEVKKQKQSTVICAGQCIACGKKIENNSLYVNGVGPYCDCIISKEKP